MFTLLPRNCNHTVTQVTLQGIGVNSLHFNHQTFCTFCFPGFTSFFICSFLFYYACVLSLSFVYLLVPIMWLFLVCLKTCFRLVKHEGSDIVWPLLFVGIKKSNFQRPIVSCYTVVLGHQGWTNFHCENWRWSDHEPCPIFEMAAANPIDWNPCHVSSHVDTVTISVNILIFFLLRQKHKKALL